MFSGALTSAGNANMYQLTRVIHAILIWYIKNKRISCTYRKQYVIPSLLETSTSPIYVMIKGLSPLKIQYNHLNMHCDLCIYPTITFDLFPVYFLEIFSSSSSSKGKPLLIQKQEFLFSLCSPPLPLLESCQCSC